MFKRKRKLICLKLILIFYIFTLNKKTKQIRFFIKIHCFNETIKTMNFYKKLQNKFN